MKRILLLPLLCAAALVFQGCNKEETAGQQLDKAVEKTKEGAKDAADKTGDALKNAGDKVKDAAK